MDLTCGLLRAALDIAYWHECNVVLCSNRGAGWGARIEFNERDTATLSGGIQNLDYVAMWMLERMFDRQLLQPYAEQMKVLEEAQARVQAEFYS